MGMRGTPRSMRWIRASIMILIIALSLLMWWELLVIPVPDDLPALPSTLILSGGGGGTNQSERNMHSPFGKETFDKYESNSPLLSRPLSTLHDGFPTRNDDSHNSTRVKEEDAPPDATKFKRILFFNRFWLDKEMRFGAGHEPFVQAGCPVSSCETATRASQKKASFSQFDAVVFSINALDLRLTPEMKNRINKWRRPEQIFIMLGYENPTWKILNFQEYNGFFNWTMTYRLDSDVNLPYGWFTPRNISTFSSPRPLLNVLPPPETWIQYDEDRFANVYLPEHREELAILAKRQKKVVWIVSNCNKAESGRLEFAKELGKYIQVDIFGNSNHDGREECQVSRTCNSTIGDGRPDDCLETAENEYKFYLSFENTLCDDYVTEKLYNRMNKFVTVSLTQANLTKILPPHSTINVLDYSSPKALAEYLHYLDRNDTAYLSYFWWKEHYEVHSHFRLSPGFCNLCSKLHGETALGPPQQTKVYENMVEWWRNSAQCGRLNPKVKEMIDLGNKQ